MKKLKILVLLLIPIRGFSQSPAAEANKSMKSASYSAPASAAGMYDAVAETFTAAAVDQSQASTFQQRGIQKLEDFYSYLTIIANQSYDKKLRKEARKQAIALFQSPNCIYKNMKITDMLDTCFYGKSVSKWTPFDFEVSKPFTLTPGDTATSYTGEIRYKIKVDDEDNNFTGTGAAQIVLIKANKHFGNRSEDLWEVFLCSIGN